MTTGAGQPYNDGTLTVVLAGATAADDEQELTIANVGSLDFTVSAAVAAVSIRARP